MDAHVIRDIIDVIRTEQRRRASLLTDEDPNAAYDQWLFTDGPFVSEVCLMLLVGLWHQIDRELLGLAARAGDDGKDISPEEYQERVQRLPQRKKCRAFISGALKLDSCEGFTSLEALRLLANLYKHDFYMQPDKRLLRLLNLETGVDYARLPESDSVRERLAVFIGLGKDADYCDIAERFVYVAGRFLADVQSRTKLSRVRWGTLSNDPGDFAR